MKDHRPLMYVSLIISLLSAGLAIASTDRVLDQSKSRGKTDPTLFGYVPTVANGAYRQFLSTVMFFSSYMGSKMFALAVLIVSSSRVIFVPIWLLFEFCLLLGVRMSIGNWRFYRKGADGVGVGLLLHLVMYISLLACPFPLFRNPVFLTPRVYSLGLLYMLLSNLLCLRRHRLSLL